MDTIARHIDQLDPDVTLIDVTPDGALFSTSTDLQHGQVTAIMFSPLEMMPANFTSSTIFRAKLVEVERWANTCDLVSCVDLSSGVRKVAVFKYGWYGQWAEKQWDELNCWMRLTGHTNIVPFDRIVTDYAELPGLGCKKVTVGFTTKFVGGGTLDDNRSRPFKFSHIDQTAFSCHRRPQPEAQNSTSGPRRLKALHRALDRCSPDFRFQLGFENRPREPYATAS